MKKIDDDLKTARNLRRKWPDVAADINSNFAESGGSTSDDVVNNSAVTGVNVTEALNELLTKQNVLRQRMHFFGSTLTTVSIGIDPVNPSFLTGMELDDGSFGVSLDIVDGAVTNETDRTIDQVIGSISFQPDKEGGGATVVHLWSERSDDGVVWTQNSSSLRVLEISNNGETFKTSLSSISDFKPQEKVRFRLYAVSGGAIQFSSPTDTVLGSEVINGVSVAWELSEN